MVVICTNTLDHDHNVFTFTEVRGHFQALTTGPYTLGEAVRYVRSNYPDQSPAELILGAARDRNHSGSIVGHAVKTLEV